MGGEDKAKVATPLSACEILEYLFKCESAAQSKEARSFLTAKWVTLLECDIGSVIKLSEEDIYRNAISQSYTKPLFFQTNAPYISKESYQRLAEGYLQCRRNKENQDNTRCLDELRAAENAVRGYSVSGK